MRIATANTNDSALDALQRRQAELQQAQRKLTSGKRVERASDDPSAAARAERALVQIGRADASQRALEASRGAMTLAEGALGDGAELLQQARETLVAAGNASYGDAERATLGQRLKGLRDQLLAVANRGDGAGGYVFGGQGSASPPFVDAPGGVVYAGTPGEQQAASGEPLPLTADGASAWIGAAGATSLFAALDRAVADLATPNRPGAQITADNQRALADVDASMQRLGSQRARLGEVLNRADGIADRLSASRLAAETERSAAEDLDMVHAISDFQARQGGYDAALKTYSMVQRLSLFDYLKG